MNWMGIAIGLFAAFVIGMGFVWVIRVEYYLGAYWWKAIFVIGIAIVASSLLAPNFLISAVLGIVGGSVAWGALELPHQEERVDHGLFRAHPNRRRHRRANAEGQGHSHGDRPGLGAWWSF